MSQALPPNDDIAELIERFGRAAAAYISGDIRGYLELIPHTSDCSLMPPYGGEPTIVGNSRTEEQIEVTSRFSTVEKQTLRLPKPWWGRTWWSGQKLWQSGQFVTVTANFHADTLARSRVDSSVPRGRADRSHTRRARAHPPSVTPCPSMIRRTLTL